MEKEIIGGSLIFWGIILLLAISLWKTGFKKFVRVRMIYEFMGEEGGTIFYYVISISSIIFGVLLIIGVI